MKGRSCFLVGAMLLLAACGGSQPAADSPPAGQDDSSAQDKSTVFDPLTQSLDRARSVQDAVDKQAEEQRRRIEEQSQ